MTISKLFRYVLRFFLPGRHRFTSPPWGEVTHGETEVSAAADQVPNNVTQRLHDSEVRLDLVLESADLAWWDHNLLTGEVVRSKNWAEMMGYSPEDIDSGVQAWKDLIHPDDQPRVEEIARRHESGQTPVFEVEHRLRTKSGEWIWVLNWGKVVERDAQGKPVRALGTHLNITRRKQAELDRVNLIKSLETALLEIKTLQGIIPICSHCKKIRDDQGYWKQLESYLKEHSQVEFSHSICPECLKKVKLDLPAVEKADSSTN